MRSAETHSKKMAETAAKITGQAVKPSKRLIAKPKMRVAVMFSGGKDSTYAVEYCLSKGWEIAYLLSVKPNRTDCYLFHYATVEHTPKQARILGLKQIYTTCNVADPVKEANIIKGVVERNPVDAVVLGGTGLQETQLGSLQNALLPLGVEVFSSHAGMDHDVVMQEMIEKGYDIRITQFASDGFGREWLGKRKQLKVRALQFGFHVGGEGGYYDTFVCDGPIFKQKIKLNHLKPVMESSYAGHLLVEDLMIQEKQASPPAMLALK